MLGILLADRFEPPPRAAFAAAAIAFAAGVVWRRRGAAFACALGAIAAASGGALATQLDDARRAQPGAPFEATLDGSVVAVARGSGSVEVELAQVVAAPGEEQRVPRRVRVRSADGAAAAPLDAALPGDRLRLRARLRAPESRANPVGRDRTRALERRGIGAVGVLVHPSLCVRLADAEGARPLEWLHAFRARASAALRARGEGGALLAALALGERGGLAFESREQMRQLGLSHLLSVSGLHLAIAAAGAYRLVLALARRTPRVRDARRVALAGAASFAIGYALLAGFGVPVQRSLAMLLALAWGVAVRRPVRRAAPLGLAALAILAADPAALFDAGAQMSFLACAALVLGLRAPNPAPGLRGRVADLLETSALATAATAPVAATLGRVSPWGLAANLVAVPWTGLVLLPFSFAAVGLAALGAPAEPLLRAAASLAEASLAALAAASRVAPAAFETSPNPVAIALALAAWLALLAARGLAARVVGAVGVTFGLALTPAPAVDPAPPRVVALDVGQGDAMLVQGRRGAILVDAGTALPGRWDAGAAAVVPALRALGVERLDLVAASHADLDHRGGLGAVLGAFPVARLWLPHGGVADPAFGELLAAARARGVLVEERGAGDPPLEAGDLRATPLWPPRAAATAHSRNDASLVLRVEAGVRAVLLTGDLEAEAERALVASGAPLAADVVKLAHHGSRTSSTAALLDAAGGAVAIASAPRFGRFGMPHAEVLRRARERGYAIWWTGRDGAVFVSLADRLWVRGWR